jgi:hypothetical protein
LNGSTPVWTALVFTFYGNKNLSFPNLSIEYLEIIIYSTSRILPKATKILLQEAELTITIENISIVPD